MLKPTPRYTMLSTGVIVFVLTLMIAPVYLFNALSTRVTKPEAATPSVAFEKTGLMWNADLQRFVKPEPLVLNPPTVTPDGTLVLNEVRTYYPPPASGRIVMDVSIQSAYRIVVRETETPGVCQATITVENNIVHVGEVKCQ